MERVPPQVPMPAEQQWRTAVQPATLEAEDYDEAGSEGSGTSRSEFTASSDDGGGGDVAQASPMLPPPPTSLPAVAAPPQRNTSAVWRVPEVSPGIQTDKGADISTVVLFIDPRNAAPLEWRPLVAAARDAGHLPVAVITPNGGGADAAATLAARPEAEFVHVLCGSPHDKGSLTALAADVLNAAQLGRFRPVAALPASLGGAACGDALAALLGLPHNGLDTALSRTDKAQAVDTLRAVGLATPPGGRARWPDDAWAVGRAHGFPLVVRDCHATSRPGAPAAWRCDTEAGVGAAIGRAMELSKDPSQRTRRCVLVQPLIKGDAFLVSLFASRARDEGHALPRVTCLWRFQPHASAADAVARANAQLAAVGASTASDVAPRRSGGTPSCPYDQAVLVDATAPAYADLVAYACHAASALGLTVGVAHIKLRATAVLSSSTGASLFVDPVLVAFNPMAAPGGFDELATRAMASTGKAPWSPFAATVAAATRVADLSDPLPSPPPPPVPVMHARIVYVAAPAMAVKVQAWEGEAQVARLRSYVSHSLGAKPGGGVTRQAAPQPCRNAIAAVRLAHKDQRQVEEDARAVWSHLRCICTPDSTISAKASGQCAQQ
jgi:hypothetical protein